MGTAADSFGISSLDGPFGARITGLDTGRELDEDVTRALLDALFEHHILIVAEQEPSAEQFLRFGRLWGAPIVTHHPDDRHAQIPEIITIRNSPTVAPAMRDSALHWHQDTSYETVPAFVTMLCAVEAPATGGETLFADLVATYDALPEETKNLIDDLRVVHDPAGGKVLLPGEKVGQRKESATRPTVTHPLVLRHPVVGRKSLYGISGTTVGIEGWPEADAIDLLIELKKSAIQTQFRQTAKAETKTILIWDNFSVMHSATPSEYSDEDGKRRLVHRISTRGLPPIYARSG